MSRSDFSLIAQTFILSIFRSFHTFSKPFLRAFLLASPGLRHQRVMSAMGNQVSQRRPLNKELWVIVDDSIRSIENSCRAIRAYCSCVLQNHDRSVKYLRSIVVWDLTCQVSGFDSFHKTWEVHANVTWFGIWGPSLQVTMDPWNPEFGQIWLETPNLVKLQKRRRIGTFLTFPGIVTFGPQLWRIPTPTPNLTIPKNDQKQTRKKTPNFDVNHRVTLVFWYDPSQHQFGLFGVDSNPWVRRQILTVSTNFEWQIRADLSGKVVGTLVQISCQI